MKTIARTAIALALLVLTSAAQNPVAQQPEQSQPASATEYKPKFPGDPAHSDAEAAALGYMRTVVNAQKNFYKRHQSYALSLHELVGQGSFTRRMEKTDRGDYTARFHSTGKEYSVTMTPKQFDAAHRAFYVDDTGMFRVEDSKPATKSSAPLRQ